MKPCPIGGVMCIEGDCHFSLEFVIFAGIGQNPSWYDNDGQV